MSALYEIRDLHLSLPDMSTPRLFGPRARVNILKGLSFDVPRGATLGIVGGSGSGKTTLGRAMMRLLGPTGGSVVFDGTDITHMKEDELRPVRRRIQMIFQDPMSSLNPRHRVRRLIGAPLRLHGLFNPAKVDEALSRVGLPPDFADRYPHELSGGQRQRVGIARAIALEPEFLLADEIVSGLDVSSQAQVLNLLDQLKRDMGLTVAFISHDLSVIRRLCDHVLVLHDGGIVENAPVEQVFDAPQAAYTKELLSAIPLPDPDQPWT